MQHAFQIAASCRSGRFAVDIVVPILKTLFLPSLTVNYNQFEKYPILLLQNEFEYVDHQKLLTPSYSQNKEGS